MNYDRFRALSGEPLNWTRHENTAAFGVNPVVGPEMIRCHLSDGSSHPDVFRADCCNWGYMVDGPDGKTPVSVVAYETCEPRFPELAKEREAKDAGSQKLGELLEWLQTQGLVIAEWEGPQSLRVSQRGSNTNGLIAEFFGIDTKQSEAERQQLLDEFLKSQQDTAQ